MQNIIWKTEDGNDLALYLWDKVAIPKGVVQIIHDIGEHMMRYDAFANYLNEQGYMVIGADHRSHGMTAKTRDNIGKAGKGEDIYEKTMIDVIAIAEYLSFMYTNLPIAVLGQGYGTFFVQDYYLKRVMNPKVQGIVLASPTLFEGFGFRFAKLSASMGSADKIADGVYKRTSEKYDKRFKEGKNAWRCRDKAVVELYNKDEFVAPVTNGYFKSFFKGAGKIYKKPNNAQYVAAIPALITCGSADPWCVEGAFANGVNLKLKGMGIQNIDFRLYKDCRYEVLNEPNKKQIWKDITNFLNTNLSKQKLPR